MLSGSPTDASYSTREMVMEKAGLKAEPMIQIGGLKREKKSEDKEMAVAE